MTTIVPEIRRDQWIKHFIKRFTGFTHKIFEINQDWASLTKDIWPQENPFKSTIAWMESSHFNLPDLWFLHGSESSWIFTIIHYPKIGSPWTLGFWGNFGSTFRSTFRAELRLCSPLRDKPWKEFSSSMTLGSSLPMESTSIVKISCCGILVTEKLEKWRSG